MLKTLTLICDFHASQGLTLRIVLCLLLHSVVLFWVFFCCENEYVSWYLWQVWIWLKKALEVSGKLLFYWSIYQLCLHLNHFSQAQVRAVTQWNASKITAKWMLVLRSLLHATDLLTPLLPVASLSAVGCHPCSDWLNATYPHPGE